MWEAIKYVSSAFTLCAFLTAALFRYLIRRQREELLRIESAPPEEKAQLVAKTLEIFDVDTSSLSQGLQFQSGQRQKPQPRPPSTRITHKLHQSVS